MWKPAVTGKLAAEALEKSVAVCRRLSVTERVILAAGESRRQSKFPRAAGWCPYSLAQGYAGLALLWSYVGSCFPGESWNELGREHLTLAVRGLPSHPSLPVGAFSGLTGLAFAAHRLSQGGTRYERITSQLDDQILPRARLLAQDVADARGMNVGAFDVISGLSGVGAYLLDRYRASTQEGLISMTKALVQMALGSDHIPNWYTPNDLLGYEEVRILYPHGNLNLGLAHGIPGPLAFFCLAHRAQLPIPNLPDAIAHLANWICCHRLDDEWGINWPTAVPVVQNGPEGGVRLSVGDTKSAPGGPSRSAWCYGSPGIARALWLAGEVLGQDEYRHVAVSAMQAVFRRPVSVRQINSPTFCHGVAGLLQIALRFANDQDGQMFTNEIADLVRQILDCYQPGSLLGFKNIEGPGHEIEQPGLLDGAPGVALVLLAASTSAEPVWDRLFLLA